MNKSKHRREVERSKGPPPDPGPWVYITYRSETHTDNGPEPTGPYEKRPDDHIYLSNVCVHRERPEGFFLHQVKVSPEVLVAPVMFLVTARYKDGGSFKNTYGNFKFVGVFADEAEARGVADAIRKNGTNGSLFRDMPWVGDYFARLESVDVTCHTPGEALDGEVNED